MSRLTRESFLAQELANAHNLLCLQTEEIRILKAHVADLEEIVESKSGVSFVDYPSEFKSLQEL